MNLSTLRANWRTSLSGIGAALFSVLTIIAALPYELGTVATIIPAEWKAKVAIAGAVATVLLRVINAMCAKDSAVSGNGTMADPARVADPQAPGGSRILPVLLAFALLSVSLSGCAGLSPRAKEKWSAKEKPASAWARPSTPEVMRLDTLYHQGEVIQGAVIVTKVEEE